MTTTKKSADGKRSTRKKPPADSGKGSSQAPRLQFHFLRLLGTLLLLNVLPMIVLALVLIDWKGGPHLRADLDRSRLTVIVTVAVCSAAIAISGWLLYPLARWLYAWPRWHYLHGNSVVWALPMVLGTTLWAALGLLSIGVTLGALWIIGTGLFKLLSASPHA